MSTTSAPVVLIGRSSSHFTRVAAIVARELGVPYRLVPVFEFTSEDPATYGGNPALKIPSLQLGERRIFGTENICRVLASLAGAEARVVWPEQIQGDEARNAQELVWHAMAAQVQWVFGTKLARLPAENVYFAKGRAGFVGALRWLDAQLAQVLSQLPAGRALSLFEVTLFCLVEHLAFRESVSLAPYPALVAFAEEFSARPSARETKFHYDTPPST